MSNHSTVTTSPVSISLTMKDAAAALAFYEKMLGASELYRVTTPNGHMVHAEFEVRGTKLYISDEAPDFTAFAMPDGAVASCLFCIASDDSDSDYARAIAAGATSVSAPQDQFHGVRNAAVLDPFGYRWCFVQVVEQLSGQEIARRAKARFGGEAGGVLAGFVVLPTRLRPGLMAVCRGLIWASAACGRYRRA